MGNSSTAVFGDGDLYRDWPNRAKVVATASAATSVAQGTREGPRFATPSRSAVRRVKRVAGLDPESAFWLAGMAGDNALQAARRYGPVRRGVLDRVGLAHASLSFAEATALREHVVWVLGTDPGRSNLAALVDRALRAWASAARQAAE